MLTGLMDNALMASTAKRSEVTRGVAMRTKKRHPLGWVLSPAFIAVVLVCMLSVGGLVFSMFVLGMGNGSPYGARQWRTAFADVPDPETARARHPEVAVKRYENGEWIFGIGKDSHGSPFRGGTIVVKDSRGHTRAFFGHVCGDSILQKTLDKSKSLEEFYQSLQTDEFLRHCNLQEHTFPEP
jgi:hypothetical protein